MPCGSDPSLPHPTFSDEQAMDIRRASIAAPAAYVFPTFAYAHHAMDNATPSTLFEGFVSGLAHPVIGPDHLLFVLAVGAACYAFRLRAGTVAAFLAAALVGALAHLYSADAPYADAWVALSLIVAGALLLSGARYLRGGVAAGVFALAGIAHGYAYAEAIVGAEATPLAAYLAGFTLVQLAIICGGYVVARALERRGRAPAANTAFAGVLSIAGAVFLVLAIAG